MKFKETKNKITLFDEELNECGRITFVPTKKDCILIDHTIVEAEHQNKGYAAMLLEEVVNKAKREDLLITPQCSYARRKFDDNEEYQKVEYTSK